MSSTSIGEKEENPPAENIHQFTNQQETSSSLTCSSLGNPIEVNPLVKVLYIFLNKLKLKSW